MTDDDFSCSGYKQATRLGLIRHQSCDHSLEIWRCEKPLEKLCAEADNSQTEGMCWSEKKRRVCKRPLSFREETIIKTEKTFFFWRDQEVFDMQHKHQKYEATRLLSRGHLERACTRCSRKHLFQPVPR